MILILVRGYSSGSTMDTPEPGEAMRDLLAKKQILQMEIRQRAASVPNMYHGTKLAVSLMSAEGAARVALASGPGLLVSEFNSCTKFFLMFFFSKFIVKKKRKYKWNRNIYNKLSILIFRYIVR